MKKSLRILCCAALLASSAACSKFDDTAARSDNGNADGTLLKVYADVVPNDGTRANINVGESRFTAEWEAGDALAILPVKTGGTTPTAASEFTYNTAQSAFEGTLKDFVTGGGNYYAFYPYAATTGTKANVPFGNLRPQMGNDFNSKYDALIAEPVPYTSAEAGKTDDGNPVTFKLHRLTSILNFSIETPADKVKYLLLTTGDETKKLSANSLDFSLENGGASTIPALNAEGQSNVIALQYDASADAGNNVEAFFNVPAGLYESLTLDVITSDNQIATIPVTRTAPFTAGTLYKKTASGLAFSAIAAPSLDWAGEDMNAPHDITKCGIDYQAAIQIDVPGGIAGLLVNITSDVLNAMELRTLDLFKEDIGLPGMTSGPAVQYQKSTLFDITDLVPLIGQLEAAPGSEHIFEVVVTDLAGQQTTQALKFFMPTMISYNNDADLWLNTASFSLTDIPADATSVTVQYKKSTETVWQTATINPERTLATIAPEWEDKAEADWLTPNTVLAYSRIKTGTGVFANNTYNYKLTIDGTEHAGLFTTNAGQTIPNGDMEDTALPCYVLQNASSTSETWGSGNNKVLSECWLCQQDAYTYNAISSKCAKLTTQTQSTISKKVLAAGNLFYGQFAQNGTGGDVRFGQQYTWEARPMALKLKYKASVGAVDYVNSIPKIAMSQPDYARIFISIVDWTSRHTVTSKTNVVGTTVTVTGAWDPETTNNPGEGEIIGYGSFWIKQGEIDWQNLEIPINFYNKDNKPKAENISLVISCTCSAYGDFMNGCSGNTLYVDDFEWVY